MTDAVPLAELWRGDRVESRHRGHAVVCDAAGRIRAAWGDPGAVIFPRSSCKMLQALPLVESGAAAGLTPEPLALACASHNGSALHVGHVARWLDDLGFEERDLRCGPQVPDDRAERGRLREAARAPCQLHNNCSGKHAGFLALSRHLGGDAEYVDPGHPVQRAVRASFEEMCGEASPGFGIDGCSAPNFATSVRGLARAMARMADPAGLGAVRETAARRLVAAMQEHPVLVAGEGRACTELMQAMDGRVAIKTGAEAVFVAILPQMGLGVALKIEDGATRASECAIAAILVRLGVLDAALPATRRRLAPDVPNRRGLAAARIAPAAEFWAGGAAL